MMKTQDTRNSTRLKIQEKFEHFNVMNSTNFFYWNGRKLKGINKHLKEKLHSNFNFCIQKALFSYKHFTITISLRTYFCANKFLFQYTYGNARQYASHCLHTFSIFFFSHSFLIFISHIKAKVSFWKTVTV